ncbi:MAG TPA: hypothetical protein VFK57_08735 [Vicinamibacterales bacterium]|nr:hypothetical protein [Vicinamibacterales bacterium]
MKAYSISAVRARLAAALDDAHARLRGWRWQPATTAFYSGGARERIEL